ncbi:hypothetical protein [Leptolyngbya sp. CCY15150]|uniref:ribbon-helix-helix domain-containing protein n=1 Tax=Leptolyngbya sp. CCY15150 TaxID=2767772 RepID=UPI0019513B30
MAKRVFASVSDALSSKLEQRANVEGRSLSNLISYLLEREMENWRPPMKRDQKEERYE